MFYFREICCTAVHYFDSYISYDDVHLFYVESVGIIQWRYYSAIDFIYRRGTAFKNNDEYYFHLFTRPRIFSANQYYNTCYCDFERKYAISQQHLSNAKVKSYKKLNIYGMTLILPAATKFSEKQNLYTYCYNDYEFINFDHYSVAKYDHKDIKNADKLFICNKEIFLPMEIKFNFKTGLIEKIEMIHPIYKNNPGKDIILNFYDVGTLKDVEIKWQHGNKIVEFSMKLSTEDLPDIQITYVNAVTIKYALTKAYEILLPIIAYKN